MLSAEDNTLLTRTGASISFANGTDLRGRRRARRQRPPVESARPPGAMIELVWPQGELVVEKAEARRALGPNQPVRQPL